MVHLVDTLNADRVLDSDDWMKAVQLVGGFDPTTRGSGTATALLAAKLASSLPSDPGRALVLGANALGSDTDTICTMAGALLGAANPTHPIPTPVLDGDFISRTAAWLDSVSRGNATGRFRYPDLLDWSLPRSALDYVGTIDDQPALAGLGVLTYTDGTYAGPRGTEVWELAELDFGQTVLVRRRSELERLPSNLAPRRRGLSSPGVAPGNDQAATLPLFDADPERAGGTHRDKPGARADRAAQRSSSQRRNEHTGREFRLGQELPDPLALDVAIDLVVGSGCPADLVGEVLLALAQQEGGIQEAVAFASTVAKAYKELPHR